MGNRSNYLLLGILTLAIMPGRAQNSAAALSAPSLSFRYEPVPPSATPAKGAAGSPLTGDSLDLVVRVELREGWHINSAKPLDDYLVPTSLEVKAQGIRFGKPLFPEPVMLHSKVMGGDLSLYTESFEVTIPAKRLSRVPSIAPKAEAPGVTRVTLHYQACNDSMCLPPKSITVEN